MLKVIPKSTLSGRRRVRSGGLLRSLSSTVGIHSGKADASSNLSETFHIPSREEMLKQVRQAGEVDLVIVGGGATGAGAALDAAQRGLRVVCLEREDFASATSSRSTKLLWGGSRYLVQALVALFNFDLRLIRSPSATIKKFLQDFRMVLNCHRERTFMMKKQPHLTNWIPIAVPLDRWLLWPPPFGYPPAALGPLGIFTIFFKFYDALSGFQCPPSHVMSRRRAERKFPQLANNKIKYCSVFYEGMHDDARTNLSIAQTAALNGASMLNYCQVNTFVHGEDGQKVIGVKMRDLLTQEEVTVRAKRILLCCGPFTDELRKEEDPQCTSAVTGAAGVHIVLPPYFAPPGIGLVDMSTSDGRFLFFLPWQSHVLVGTTDHRCEPSMRPLPAEEEIAWLLHEASKYLSPELRLRRQDVLSAWSGIRPLAIDPHAPPSETSSASRDHVISHDPRSELLFVSGGKWTTFREMAEDAIDKVIAVTPELQKRSLRPCNTLQTHFVGYEGYSENLVVRLIQKYDISSDVAQRLATAYGGRAHDVLQIAKEQYEQSRNDPLYHEPAEDHWERRLVRGYPVLEAEVTFAARHDWACHPEDFLARRCRLLFINKAAALRGLPRVVQLMARELSWSEDKQQKELENCLEYMRHFGGAKPLPVAANEERPGRLATSDDLKEAFWRVQPSLKAINKAQLQLVAELLEYPLTEDELQDCLTTAFEKRVEGDEPGKVSLAALQSWWNSERFNPGLVKLRQRKMATAQQVEGSGTLFG